jgi:hypothetical protein
VFRFFISEAVTTLCSEIHHGVSGVEGVSDIIKSYERAVPRHQLGAEWNSTWNLPLLP